MEIKYHIVGTENSYTLMPDWTYVQSGVFVVLRCHSPPFQSGFLHFQKFKLEEKILCECGVDESTIEKIRTDDRADFNSNRRFYRWTSDFGEYLEGMADREQSAEVKTVADLLDEIEDENLYRALLTVDL